MISSQCDELRERATTLRQGRWSDGEDDATMMEQAADTILELRDDLQRANAAVQDAEHDESMAWDRVRKVEVENTKLRDFMYDMWSDMNVYYTKHESPNSSDMDFYRDHMRELGVRLDG